MNWMPIWVIGGLANVIYLKVGAAKKKEIMAQMVDDVNEDNLFERWFVEIMFYVIAFVLSWGILGLLIASRKEKKL